LWDGTAEEAVYKHTGSQTDAVTVENMPIDGQSVTKLADATLAIQLQHSGDVVSGQLLSEKALGKRPATEYQPADSFVEGEAAGRGIGDGQPHSNDESGDVNAETAIPHNGASDTVGQSQRLLN
jgi:hypothetical protein